MTLSICHVGENGRLIEDVSRERKPPFSTDAVVREFADTIKVYGLMSALCVGFPDSGSAES
jgi:hypothetical protein